MKKVIKSWLQGIAAGMCIGLGTITYLLISNKLLGAFIFAMGLFLVLTYRLKLCTGMAGYLPDRKNPSKTTGFVSATIGNINGITLMYILATLWNPSVKDLAHNVLLNKFTLLPHQAFISAIFCGMLMFLAVDIYKESADIPSRLIGIFVAVPCFILNGFDHCVVTAFYIHSSETLKEVIHSLQLFPTVMLGNFLGAIFAWWLFQHINFWRIENEKNKKKRI